jgi:hypothetical protein
VYHVIWNMNVLHGICTYTLKYTLIKNLNHSFLTLVWPSSFKRWFPHILALKKKNICFVPYKKKKKPKKNIPFHILAFFCHNVIQKIKKNIKIFSFIFVLYNKFIKFIELDSNFINTKKNQFCFYF